MFEHNSINLVYEELKDIFINIMYNYVIKFNYDIKYIYKNYVLFNTSIYEDIYTLII